MKTIYKYPIQITEEQEIQMPLASKIIRAGLDPQGTPCVRALVDTESSPWPASILVVGTGCPMPSSAGSHVGSFVQGPFVWHVFLGFHVFLG